MMPSPVDWRKVFTKRLTITLIHIGNSQEYILCMGDRLIGYEDRNDSAYHNEFWGLSALAHRLKDALNRAGLPVTLKKMDFDVSGLGKPDEWTVDDVAQAVGVGKE